MIELLEGLADYIQENTDLTCKLIDDYPTVPMIHNKALRCGLDWYIILESHSLKLIYDNSYCRIPAVNFELIDPDCQDKIIEFIKEKSTPSYQTLYFSLHREINDPEHIINLLGQFIPQPNEMSISPCQTRGKTQYFTHNHKVIIFKNPNYAIFYIPYNFYLGKKNSYGEFRSTQVFDIFECGMLTTLNQVLADTL